MKKERLAGNENGAAMVIALLTLVLLTMVGTLMLAQTKTETNIAAHGMRSAQAFFNAEAGYGEALVRMSDALDTTDYVGPGMNDWITDPGWGTYIVTATGNSDTDPRAAVTETDGLDNDGDNAVDESGERYPEVKSRKEADDVDYAWVKIHYKLDGASQVYLFGDHDDDLATAPQVNFTAGTPILVITAQGDRGSARRTVEVEALQYPFETVKSPVYSEGDDFKFNGTQFLVSGTDWDPDTESRIFGNPEFSGLVTTGNPLSIVNALSSQQSDNVEGLGAAPSVGSPPVDMDLQAMRDRYVKLARTQVPGGTYTNESWGNYDSYTVVHCTGDLHASGNNVGGGLLIVDGDLEVTGSFTWYGMMLVLGDITFTGGGGEKHLYGTCLVQSSGGEQTIGGNADLLYSSEAIARLRTLAPYQVANWREL